MTLHEYIEKNRTGIDRHIKRQITVKTLTDEQRRLWVLNDYTLYRLALANGVEI